MNENELLILSSRNESPRNMSQECDKKTRKQSRTLLIDIFS